MRATSDRLASVPRVLAVHETTALDWTAHPATTGLGPLAHPAPQGWLVHTTLALTPERLPLGLLAPQVWARAPADIGTRATRKRRPLAEKERQQWLTRVTAVIEAPARGPQTRFVCIGDRAADVDDLLVQERPSGVELLVRASWNRRVDHTERDLWTTVAMHPVVATRTVGVPRHGPHPRVGRRCAGGGVWYGCVRPRPATRSNCPPWQSGPFRRWRSSPRPGVNRSSGCC